jgi:hypothetical protein
MAAVGVAEREGVSWAGKGELMKRGIEDKEGAVVEPEKRSRLRRLALVLGVGLLIAAFAPLVLFITGVLLLGMVAIRSWIPELRFYLDPVLRIPVASPKTRYSRLALLSGSGVTLVVLGAVSAMVGGAWRQAADQREAQLSTVVESADRLLEHARNYIAANSVPAAEIALLNAQAIPGLGPAKREEVNELMGRVQRSGSGNAIRAILARLSEKDLHALETGSYLPKALDFGEPALTRRAVALAIGLLSEQNGLEGES